MFLSTAFNSAVFNVVVFVNSALYLNFLQERGLCECVIIIIISTGWFAHLLSAQAIGAVGLRFDSRAGLIDIVSPTARHRCDVSSETCCPGTKPKRWAPPHAST